MLLQWEKLQLFWFRMSQFLNFKLLSFTYMLIIMMKMYHFSNLWNMSHEYVGYWYQNSIFLYTVLWLYSYSFIFYFLLWLQICECVFCHFSSSLSFNLFIFSMVIFLFSPILCYYKFPVAAWKQTIIYW